jgi:hypothetical protein
MLLLGGNFLRCHVSPPWRQRSCPAVGAHCRFEAAVPEFSPASVAGVFKEIVLKLQKEAGWQGMGRWARLEPHKCLLRKAGRLARNLLMVGTVKKSAPAAAVSQSVARAVWRSDARTAKALALANKLAVRHLDMSGPLVCLADPARFQRELEAAKSLVLNAELAAVKTAAGEMASSAAEAAARKKML